MRVILAKLPLKVTLKHCVGKVKIVSVVEIFLLILELSLTCKL
jgi:hypothetical protein